MSEQSSIPAQKPQINYELQGYEPLVQESSAHESPDAHELDRRVSADGLALWVLLGIVTLALGWILLPFYGTLLWSAIIAMVFAPVNAHMLVWAKGRKTLAALGTLLSVVVFVMVPFALIMVAMGNEAANFFEHVQSGELKPERFFDGALDALPDWLVSLLGRFGLGDFAAIQSKLSTELSQAGKFVAGRALSIGQNTLDFVANLCVATYMSFFLIRDGEVLARDARHALPLNAGAKRALFAKFTTVIRATVKGNLLVAAIQGALGGLAFWFLGLKGALLWAVVMAFLSMLPAFGATLVWLPVSVYFFLTGAVWQGVALLAWGVLVIGLVDNLLRPILVGKDTRMPDYVVMISTLGGMAVFGINGFVLGPLIAAMFIAVWHLHTTD